MMTLEEVKKLTEDKTYGRIPLTREIYSDIRTPHGSAAGLKAGEYPLLHAGERGGIQTLGPLHLPGV